MAKYIKQEAAVKAFENTKGHGFGFDLTDIKKIINSIPAADVAPVVYGKWIHDGRRCKAALIGAIVASVVSKISLLLAPTTVPTVAQKWIWRISNEYS